MIRYDDANCSYQETQGQIQRIGQRARNLAEQDVTHHAAPDAAKDSQHQEANDGPTVILVVIGSLGQQNAVQCIISVIVAGQFLILSILCER